MAIIKQDYGSIGGGVESHLSRKHLYERIFCKNISD